MTQVNQVVRVEVGEEDAVRVKGPNAGLEQPGGDARAAVHEEVLRGRRDERGGAAPRRIGRWAAGAEKNHPHGRF